MDKAGHGELKARWRSTAMVETAQCGLNYAQTMALAARGGGGGGGECVGEVDWVVLLRGW